MNIRINPIYDASNLIEYDAWYERIEAIERKRHTHEAWMDLPQAQITTMINAHNATAAEQRRVMAIQGCMFACWDCDRKSKCTAEYPEAWERRKNVLQASY